MVEEEADGSEGRTLPAGPSPDSEEGAYPLLVILFLDLC